jgi:Undecaprenyl-phosphate glucose phosphotransferase
VGAGQTAVRVTELLSNQTMFGYRVDGFLSVMHEPVEAGINCIGSIDDLRELIRKLQPYHVIFALDSTDYQSLDLAIEICDEEGVHLHVVPDYSELITNRGRLESLGGIPLITVRDIPSRRGFNRLLKRSFDIVFSSIFIVVFSPIFFLLILLIKLTSKGPVFYTQERVGLDNKVFNIIKFRTMFVQEKSQSDKVWTTQNDPRVTSIGRFMRKLSLDETPQFINVITGKMSVVGPRPERPYWVEQFKDTYHHYMQRHAVKAGITGWAQVNGFRGDTSIEQRVTADIYYIENWSFLLDLKIVLMTPFKSVIDRNAY